MYLLRAMSLYILLILNILLILSIISISYITINNESSVGQMLNQTEFDRQLKMQEQELDQQLNETAQSFNETEQLEG
jgi:spore germination protein GerM